MNTIFKYLSYKNNNNYPNIPCEEAIANVFWFKFKEYGPKDLDKKPSYWLHFESRSFSSTVNFSNQPQCGLGADRFSFNEGRLKKLLEGKKPDDLNIKVGNINIDDQDKNFPYLDIKIDYKKI